MKALSLERSVHNEGRVRALIWKRNKDGTVSVTDIIEGEPQQVASMLREFHYDLRHIKTPAPENAFVVPIEISVWEAAEAQSLRSLS